jgi:hypothetical protein
VYSESSRNSEIVLDMIDSNLCRISTIIDSDSVEFVRYSIKALHYSHVFNCRHFT